MIEYEKRYQISDDTYEAIHKCPGIEWSDVTRVIDVTFGLSGAESMQINGWVVRLRKMDEKVSLEYKAPLNKDWTEWKEIAVGIDNAKNAISMLQHIGLKPGLLLDRERITGKWKEGIVCLDKFALLGTFVELEICNQNGVQLFFRDFENKFNLSETNQCEPYGKLMLARLKDNLYLRDQVNEYLSKIT